MHELKRTRAVLLHPAPGPPTGPPRSALAHCARPVRDSDGEPRRRALLDSTSEAAAASIRKFLDLIERPPTETGPVRGGGGCPMYFFLFLFHRRNMLQNIL